MNIQLNSCSQINGEILIPSSKSHSQRALACALISKEKTRIHHLGKCDDELAALDILKECGVNVFREVGLIEIQGKGIESKTKIRVNCNESGLSSRMFTPILTNSKNSVIINGKGSLKKRPMDFFVTVFDELNLNFESNEGKLPFKFEGNLVPKSIELDGSMSSQFITGMIYAYVASPLLRQEKITIKNPNSLPYIHLSLDVLKQFGVDLVLENNSIQFNGPYELKETELKIEGDWSSASFFLVAAAIHGEIMVKNLNLESKQADIAILDVLKLFGANLEFGTNAVTVSKAQNKAFFFDATHCPDLFPPLVVLAAFADGKSTIKGVNRLFSKESNRALALEKEFEKLGIRIETLDDEMHIYPAQKLHPALIHPHGDHRIAMAAAIVSLKVMEGIIIQNKEVVNKSFPDFFVLLQGLTENSYSSIH